MAQEKIKIFKPTPKQLEVFNDPTRFKVAVWGRRSGKSTFALNLAIRICLEKPGARVWIICPTYGQAKDIYWREPEMLHKYLHPAMGAKLNESELVITFASQSVLQFKGADRPETMRGSGLDFIVCDEISEWRYAKETWGAVLSPALTNKQGGALFIGTPKGENFFKELYDQGQDPANRYWKSWKVPTWESGAPWTLTPEGQDAIERERSSNSEDYFMQEFGADFRKFTGLVFKEFDQNVHVKSFEPIERYEWTIGMDFGWTAPTTALFTYFDDDDTLWVADEYYEVEKPVKEHASRLLAKRETYKNGTKVILGDAANAQTIQDFGTYGWYITPAAKGKDSILAGINRIQERLKVNYATYKPKIIIHPRCVNLIREIEHLKWQTDRRNDELKDLPEEGGDHALDSLRYIVLHHNTNHKKAASIKPIINPYKPMGGYF